MIVLSAYWVTGLEEAVPGTRALAFADNWEFRADSPGSVKKALQRKSAVAGGVGIILKQKFLDQFDAIVPEHDWIQLVKGHVAILRLRGPLGCLDIFCCYFSTGGFHLF